MKKLLVILLVLILTCTLFAGCEYLPPEAQDAINSILGNDNPSEDGPDAHKHDFVLVSSTKPTCTEAAVDTFECACGETQVSDSGKPLGHNYNIEDSKAATCLNDGFCNSRCLRCGDVVEEVLTATGHNLASFVEMSRLMPCTNTGCNYTVFAEGNGKYTDVIVYKFTDADLDEFDRIYAELDAMIEAADEYDADLHAFVEGSEIHQQYLEMEAKYEELYSVVEYVVTQYQIAQIEYHMNMKDKAKEEAYNHISEVRTDLVARFYEFSTPIYNSMYRDYYYENMTEQEIMAFLLESDAVSNPEYKALLDRNTAIELEFNEISNPKESKKVLELYGEFVANNKRIAEIMNYDNYLEYAYENVYSRDYTYQDVAKVAGYVKQHLSGAFGDLYNTYLDFRSSTTLTKEDKEAYYNQSSASFFTNYEANKYLNDYMDVMNLTSNPDKQVSFSDELNDLMGDGNLFRGGYKGAYVTSLYDINLPIAYFGPGYEGATTVAHEFGHYINEVYNQGEFDQSYDLLEMHSQGNELVFLAYLKDKLPEGGFKYHETYQLLNMYMTVVSALAVDTFEQAIYTDNYTGAYSKQIMADGTITTDEYDMLYRGILVGFGVKDYENVGFGGYWRYVTISAPCYYVSYSVSALSVLQLYANSDNIGFEATKDAYLKLFTYTDENPEMTTAEILENAGLYSFTDENLYILLAEMFSAICE